MALKLYTIETNDEFPLEAVDVSLLRSVAAAFGASQLTNATRVRKRNPGSTIYRVEASPAPLMLRAISADLAELTERQCELVFDLPFEDIIKPCRSATGFTVSKDNLCWMAYPALDGTLFDGRNCSVERAVEKAIGLLDVLGQNAWTSSLVKVRHRPDYWPDTMKMLCDPLRLCGDPAIAAALSPPMVEFIGRKAEELVRWAEEARDLDGQRSLVVVHNDLQHANVLVAAGQPRFLDVEDIMYEDPRIALGHAAFKLARHAIFTGATTAEDIRKVFVPWLRTRIAGTRYHPFLPFARFRILSDIAEIVLWCQERRHPSQLYDLEKRLANIFELDDLFGVTVGPAITR
jgi:hypothetical protein